MIARYGKAIERDLLTLYGLDLATEWRSRRWRRLLNLIDALPTHSHYMQAVTDDETYAAAVLATEDSQPKAARRQLVEWNPQIELLSNLLDRVGELISVTLAVAGSKKPARTTPAPRPRTGIDRLREKRRLENHQQLTARLLPGRHPDTGGST